MIRIFENPQLDLKMQMITDADQHYFKAKEVALALDYEDPKDAIKTHVPQEYRKRLEDIKGGDSPPPCIHTPALSRSLVCMH